MNREDYTIGTRIKNVSPQASLQENGNFRKIGTIVGIHFETYQVKYDDGSEGETDEPEIHYEIVGRPVRNGGDNHFGLSWMEE